MTVAGQDLGYYPNAGKCWLVTKPDKEGTARSIFEEMTINITTEGRKPLAAALSSRSYLEQYVNGKVEEWEGQVIKLAEFALSKPQTCYAAFTFGLKHRLTYFPRSLPDLEDLLAPLERAKADVLIPCITGHYSRYTSWTGAAGAAGENGRHGPKKSSQVAASEYVASANISGPLAQPIKSQVHKPPDENEIHVAQREICQLKNQYLKEKLDQVKGSVSGKAVIAVSGPCHPERFF